MPPATFQGFVKRFKKQFKTDRDRSERKNFFKKKLKKLAKLNDDNPLAIVSVHAWL